MYEHINPKLAIKTNVFHKLRDRKRESYREVEK